MDKANIAKEKAKVLSDDLRAERQLTLEKDEQTILFSWYYKGFKFLWWYLVKHPTGVDLENLDLEVVDKDMAADEASQSTVVASKENAPEPTQASGDKAEAWIYLM